jgi:hypothetical protein
MDSVFLSGFSWFHLCFSCFPSVLLFRRRFFGSGQPCRYFLAADDLVIEEIGKRRVEALVRARARLRNGHVVLLTIAAPDKPLARASADRIVNGVAEPMNLEPGSFHKAGIAGRPRCHQLKKQPEQRDGQPDLFVIDLDQEVPVAALAGEEDRHVRLQSRKNG